MYSFITAAGRFTIFFGATPGLMIGTFANGSALLFDRVSESFGDESVRNNGQIVFYRKSTLGWRVNSVVGVLRNTIVG